MTRSFLTQLKAAARDTKKEFQEAQLALTASSLAYTTILSIVPLLAVSFSIFHAFGGMEKLLSTVEPFIIENLAQGSSTEAMETVRRLIGNAHAGAIGVGGMIGLIITSMSMLSSAEKSINRVWKTSLNRTWFQRISAYWLFITLGPLALSVAFGAATSSQLKFVKIFPSGFGFFISIWFLLFIIYKWVPNRPVHTWPALFSAALIAGIWSFARLAYSLYTQNVVNYSKIYGSLGAIPILLLWIYILWLMILTGAAVTASIQRKLDKN